MNVKTVVSGYIQSNCHLLSNDTAAIIIDPYILNNKITEFLDAQKGKEIAVLLTHCHFDHILAAPEIREKYGAKIYIHTLDNEGLKNPSISLADNFGELQRPFSADIKLNDNDIIKIGDITVRVLHTPGHTKGGCCFIVEDSIFSGDTLFYRTIGRTDMPGSSIYDMENSLKKLMNLSDDLCVYCGHGQSTTIGYERKNNPFIRNLQL